jgi:hypothetical protein
METIKEKSTILTNWMSQLVWGPALSDYIKTTVKESLGAFKLTLCDRQKVSNECCAHIERLLKELDRRFVPSPVHESLSVLFDPRYLIAHKKDIASPTYGRSELDFLRRKYERFDGFVSNDVRSEWESFKLALSDFVNFSSTMLSPTTFWKDFLALKRSTNVLFQNDNKNVLLLLGIYLIAPTNSAECERGVWPDFHYAN